MMVIFYYDWSGTVKSMQEWEKEWKAKYDKAPKGVKLVGMYTPSIAWNRAWIFETDSIDSLMATWGARPDNVRNTDMVILS
jgi:hypothetical protein